MLNYRNVACRTRSVTHDVHSNIGSSNHSQITSVFSLASVLLSSACVKHAGNYGGYLEIAEESFIRKIKNITRIQVEPGKSNLLCVSTRRFKGRSDSRSYSPELPELPGEGRAIIKLSNRYIGYFLKLLFYFVY